MQSRTNFISKGKSAFRPVEGVDRTAEVVYPIIASSDVTGAVILLGNDGDEVPTESETKLAQVAASFLGKQMEE